MPSGCGSMELYQVGREGGHRRWWFSFQGSGGCNRGLGHFTHHAIFFGAGSGWAGVRLTISFRIRPCGLSLRGNQTPIAWLKTVANNRLIDYQRRKKVRDMVPIEDNYPDPKDDFSRIDLKMAFAEAFKSLTENEQRVLYEYSIGKTYAEIAEETELRD